MPGTLTPDFSSSGAMTPAGYARAITPADTDLPEGATRGIYVGGSGNLSVVMVGNGATVVFTNVVAGTLYPIRAIQIKAATTATGVVACW